MRERTRRPIQELVVHIGSGKTGSSSIQYFLRDNRRRLADLGYLYPQTPGGARHIRLGLYLKSDAELEASVLWQRQRESEPVAFRESFRRELLREIDQSGLSRVLLSDESLYDQAGEPAQRRLRPLTDELTRSLRLVVYLRRQDDHLISRYQQRVKNGTEIRRLDEFARKDASMPYDYGARLRLWEDVLAPDRLVVRRFERDSFVDGSLVADFLHAAGVDLRIEDLEHDRRRNASLDAEGVEFLRIFNLYRIEAGGGTRGAARELAERSPYQQLVTLDNREVFARLVEGSTGDVLTLPTQVLDAFMAQWEQSNREVAQRYLGSASGRLFPTPRRGVHTTTEQRLDPARIGHYLTLLELPERMHGPLRSLAEREASAVD